MIECMYVCVCGRNYGVYFNEIREPRSLQQRVIIELKHAGYLSYHTPREPDRIEKLRTDNRHMPLEVSSICMYVCMNVCNGV